MPQHTFIVDRKTLAPAGWQERACAPLGKGEVRLRIDSFALTANNITYGAFGATMNYWAFFPTGDDDTGCIPVWGYAVVDESRCAGLEAGERFYGYCPMASELVVAPSRVDAAGFFDDAAHRRGLHAVYNRYQRCGADPDYHAEHEAEQALLRPLFTTSFLIDDHLADHGFFDADLIVLSSASSKTAYGTAHCLAQRHGADGAPEVVGLTSPAHAAFVAGLGCYDQVLPYDAVATLDARRRAAYVDFSGNASLRRAVHGQFGANLVCSTAVGGTHWQNLGRAGDLPGEPPTLFFAPAQWKKRIADWGAVDLQRRCSQAWAGFMGAVTRGPRPWLTVVHHRGTDAIARAYRSVLDGRAKPQEGLMLHL